MQFKDFNIEQGILKALSEKQYLQPTPIQEQAIPIILSGKDLLGCAQTGTGKTAAFAIPILQKVYRDRGDIDVFPKIKALILAPTRELGIQIGESFSTYGQHLLLQTGVIYGGITPKRHIKVLKRGVDILVATPGRFLDLYEQGCIDLAHIEFLVLDEADKMLDLGMIKDVKTIISKLPKHRQNLLFSATMPKEIQDLTKQILKNPAKVEIKKPLTKKVGITQRVYYVDDPDKVALLLHLLKNQALESVLVFVKTKGKADKVAKAINVINIRTKAIHGDKNQSERQKALELFKNKEIRVLVATDVAARGIDIDRLTHVINLDIPNVPEAYVHRIGRTGRAGMQGTALSFCSNQEIESLKAIEKYQGKAIQVIEDHPYPLLNRVLKINRAKYEAEHKQSNEVIKKEGNKKAGNKKRK